MTEKEIIRDNILIARFKGADWELIGKDNLKYHIKWDCLMPVIEKILHHGWELDGVLLQSQVLRGLMSVNIEYAWLDVVQFAKWYLTTHKKQINRENN